LSEIGPTPDGAIASFCRRSVHRQISDRRPNAIENGLTDALLNAKTLVELVDFRPDLLLGLARPRAV